MGRSGLVLRWIIAAVLASAVAASIIHALFVIARILVDQQ